MQYHSSPNHRQALSFEHLVEQTETTAGVARSDVRTGDCVHVYTMNSLYRLRVLDDGRFSVQGGWFDRQLPAARSTSVTGCTWGGSAIRRDLIAGCGMRIEFENRVITSPVIRVVHFPGGVMN